MIFDSTTIIQIAVFLLTLFTAASIAGREYVGAWLMLAIVFLISIPVGAYVLYGHHPIDVLLLKARMGTRFSVLLAFTYGLIAAVLVISVKLIGRKIFRSNSPRRAD